MKPIEVVSVIVMKQHLFLNKTLKTKVRTDIPGITYMEVNDPHYWNAEYDDKENRLCLAW